MRIHLNRIIEKRVEEVNKYELKRYEKRNLDNQIIAEFQCTFCNFPQYMEFPVVIYLKRFFDKENKDIDELIAEMKCDNCGDDGLTLNQII
jgi:hypothetical protein